MINVHLVYISIFISLIFTILLEFQPGLDLWITGLFYTQEQKFLYKSNIFVKYNFTLIPWITKYSFMLCMSWLTVYYLHYKTLKKTLLSVVGFVLTAGLLGPGLVVNFILKNHIGRARPSQIIHFNGAKNFTTVFTVSDQCVNNCSFPSGHAAMAFYFTIFAYALVLYYPKYSRYFSAVYILSLCFGLTTGLCRMIMGGHFLSDVLASSFIILSINHFFYLMWRPLLLAP